MTLSAKPCEVTPCETWTPMAAIFFSWILPPAMRPDAGALADALRHDAEVAAGTDEDLFEHADEVDGAEVRAFFAGQVAAQIDDGVADELAGAVIGDVAATVDLVELDAALARNSSAARTLVRLELRPSVSTGGCSSRRSVSPMRFCLRAAMTCCWIARARRRGCGRDGGGGCTCQSSPLNAETIGTA